MSRITVDNKCRLCRAEGTKLYLKGDRCTSKCPIDRKGAVKPGMHGPKGGKKPTDYGIQLRAKQKAKRIYVIAETQFHNYYLQAKKLKGLVGNNLITLIEKRLDNLVFEGGLAPSRSSAKQLVGHGHVSVNGKVVTVPSYSVKVGDTISVTSNSLQNLSANFRLADKDFKSPSWLDVKKTDNTVKLISEPDPSESQNGIDVNLIIEYYSR